MSKNMSHFAPTDITGIAAWLRQRAEGHAPDFDIAVYATPEIWSAIADQLATPQAADDTDDRMVKIEKLIADMQSIRDRFGNTCVYIRRGGLSWGAVALNRCDDDKKHGVFDLQAQHNRDMVARLEQIERLKASRDRAEAESRRLHTAIREACDLLAERTYGNAARSPGHNARVLLESAVKTSAAPSVTLTGNDRGSPAA